MIRRLVASTLAACLLALPVAAAPADYGPPDGWAAERARLANERRNPVVTSVLNGLIPGMGSAYSGDTLKAVIQASGALGVLVGSLLLSTLVRSITKTPEASLIVAIAPYPAYLGWAVTDGYFSVALKNEQLDHQIQQLAPLSLRVVPDGVLLHAASF